LSAVAESRDRERDETDGFPGNPKMKNIGMPRTKRDIAVISTPYKNVTVLVK
jgi:hypothetical protein